MTVYNEILNQIQTLSITDQNRLFQELKNRLYNSDDLDLDEDFTDEDLAESESEWQNYLKGSDQGKSLQSLELELFGGEVE
jgi:esterase/lipase superfamily enzyme